MLVEEFCKRQHITPRGGEEKKRQSALRIEARIFAMIEIRMEQSILAGAKTSRTQVEPRVAITAMRKRRN